MADDRVSLVVGQKAWYGFPRSFGLITASVLYAYVNGNPEYAKQPSLDSMIQSIVLGLTAWFVIAFIRRLFPDIYMRNFWNWCGISLIVIPLSAWPVKWILIAIACIVATFRGSPLGSSLIIGLILIGIDFLFQMFTNV